MKRSAPEFRFVWAQARGTVHTHWRTQVKERAIRTDFSHKLHWYWHRLVTSNPSLTEHSSCNQDCPNSDNEDLGKKEWNSMLFMTATFFQGWQHRLRPKLRLGLLVCFLSSFMSQPLICYEFNYTRSTANKLTQPTTTDTTINFTSNQPMEYKTAAYRLHISRMHSMPLTPGRKQKEWATIQIIAQTKPSNAIKTNKLSNTECVTENGRFWNGCYGAGRGDRDLDRRQLNSPDSAISVSVMLHGH
jgi:hypothetical protein